jgi:hypothetical protein
MHTVEAILHNRECSSQRWDYGQWFVSIYLFGDILVISGLTFNNTDDEKSKKQQYGER